MLSGSESEVSNPTHDNSLSSIETPIETPHAESSLSSIDIPVDEVEESLKRKRESHASTDTQPEPIIQTILHTSVDLDIELISEAEFLSKREILLTRKSAVEQVN